MFTNHVVIVALLKSCGNVVNEVLVELNTTSKKDETSPKERLLSLLIQFINCIIPSYFQDQSLLPIILALSKYVFLVFSRISLLIELCALFRPFTCILSSHLYPPCTPIPLSAIFALYPLTSIPFISSSSIRTGLCLAALSTKFLQPVDPPCLNLFGLPRKSSNFDGWPPLLVKTRTPSILWTLQCLRKKLCLRTIS